MGRKVGFSRIPRQKALNLIGYFLHVFHQLVEITVSVCLLPVDNAVLLASYMLGIISARSSIRRRQSVLQDVQFYPKTILVTGIDTPHGLSVARCWYYEGHRVVGVEVRDLPVRSGESMSKTLGAFYYVPKSQYVSRLLDIVNREKVDVWIPCSERISVLEDAMAKQVVESRTYCKCMHLDTEFTNLLGHSESFHQYLIEKGLPVLGNHRVQSRDSIHKILNRSPTKLYLMQEATPVPDKKQAIVLPKRTSSQTYSDVSEIQISKDKPWLLQQQIRLGEFHAEMLVVRGHITAIKVKLVNEEPGWGSSRLDEGLVIAIQKLMESFAMKSGPRLTGHLAVKMMVDEEFDSNSVRYVIHIAGCTQGAAAVKSLLQDASCPVTSGYLRLLYSQPVKTGDSGEAPDRVKAIISLSPRPRAVPRTTMVSKILKSIPLSQSGRELVDALFFEAKKFLFWKDWRYSSHDPLPWWWHAHIYRPLSQMGSILTGVGVSNVQ